VFLRPKHPISPHLSGFHLFVQVPYLITRTGGSVIKHKD